MRRAGRFPVVAYRLQQGSHVLSDYAHQGLTSGTLLTNGGCQLGSKAAAIINVFHTPSVLI
jgi:hypothetical protein